MSARVMVAVPELREARRRLVALERQAGRVVREYDAQGDHRTGSANDAASARWLARWVERSGASAAFDNFELDRIDPLDCGIEIEGRKVNGVPLFDGGFTSAAGISGRLGLFGEDCEIGLEEIIQSGADGKATRSGPAGDGRHKAIVRLTHGARPGLILANAPRFLRPSGVPTVQVSGAEADWLKALARAGAQATVTAHVKRRRAMASNVVATLPGSQPELAPMIVSTPRSGWWSCASERGGGIVCWLEALKRLSADQPARTCIFVAFSGHELGLLGGRHFARSAGDTMGRARSWLHFGANLGAPGMPVRLQSSDRALLDLARPFLEPAGIEVPDETSQVTPRGEAAIPHEAGIPYLAPISGSQVFHHSADRWPEAVDTAALARLAGAFARVAKRMSEA